MTLQKVAKLAGVSVSTASKALSDGKDVSEETKAIVKKAAEELGYFSQVKKRRYENRKHSSVSVGIICPEIISIHYSETVTTLCRMIEENGGKAYIFITDFSEEKLQSVFERCIAERNIDAVISLDGTYSGKPSDIPIPVIYTSTAADGYCVCADTKDGIFKAISYLSEMGHTKIGFAGEPLTLSKEKIFKKSMDEIVGGFCDRHLFCGTGRFEESGHNAALRFLKLSKTDRPTAILCAYDEIAYGFMRTVRENSVKIPEDLSIIGINDIPTSRFLDTPLTSVRCSNELRCKKMYEMLCALLLNKSFEPKMLMIPCEIAKRSSVGKINKAQ